MAHKRSGGHQVDTGIFTGADVKSPWLAEVFMRGIVLNRYYVFLHKIPPRKRVERIPAVKCRRE
jgi:hypothetical protein